MGRGGRIFLTLPWAPRHGSACMYLLSGILRSRVPESTLSTLSMFESNAKVIYGICGSIYIYTHTYKIITKKIFFLNILMKWGCVQLQSYNTGLFDINYVNVNFQLLEFKVVPNISRYYNSKFITVKTWDMINCFFF